MSFLSLTLILFLIMDSIGSIYYIWEMLQETKEISQKKYMILLREMGIALGTMILFYFIGDFILDQLEISETTVRVASGTIMFLLAVKILFPSTFNIRASLKMEGEPFIVPIAIPLIAGPSLLATIMLYAHDTQLSYWVIPATIIAWFTSLVILLLGPYIIRVMGRNGLVAAERLLAMVLVMLAIQRFLEGIQLFIRDYAPHLAS